MNGALGEMSLRFWVNVLQVTNFELTSSHSPFSANGIGHMSKPAGDGRTLYVNSLCFRKYKPQLLSRYICTLLDMLEQSHKQSNDHKPEG
jgi:hypothetical protein